jgi:hypothetical protein
VLQPGREVARDRRKAATISDIGKYAQILSSLATLVVASEILYQGRQARKVCDVTDRRLLALLVACLRGVSRPVSRAAG